MSRRFSFWGKTLIIVLFLSAPPDVSGSQESNPHCYDQITTARINLRRKGYDVDSIDEIIRATESSSFFERTLGLQLLAHHRQDEAIPLIVKFLDDKHIDVRIEAAHLLGQLGEKSGHAQMQEDFESYKPYEAMKTYFDTDKWKALPGRGQSDIYWSLIMSLKIGKVLAELGDWRAYDLAKKLILDGPPQNTTRSNSVFVLVEIAKADSVELEKKGLQPVLYLCAAVKSTTYLTTYTSIVGRSRELIPQLRIEILEAAVKNPHQKVDGAQLALKKLRSQMNKPD